MLKVRIERSEGRGLGEVKERRILSKVIEREEVNTVTLLSKGLKKEDGKRLA